MTTEKNRQQLEQELKALRAELAALREVEAKRNAIEDVLRGLEKGLDTMQLGVTITDVGGRIVYVNDADAKMHNRSVDELMGRDVGILAPAGRRKPLTVQQLRDLSSWKRESVNARKDGSVFPVLLRSDVVTDEAGEPLGLVTTCEDISQLRSAEEALQRSEAEYGALVEHATYGIWRSTADGKFVAVNPALAKILGHGSTDELLAVDFANDVFLDRGGFTSLIDRLREADRIEGLEVEWVTKNGSQITVRLSGRAVPSPEGDPQGFEFIAEDVTERLQVAAQLKQAQKMEALWQLTGGIAHDFNNILTVIQANLGLMAHELPAGSDQLATELGEAQMATLSGTKLIKKLMAFSRTEDLSLEPLDLTQFVGGLSSTLRRLLPENVEIEIHPAELVGAISADRHAIEQILFNLATNARDAMPDGGLIRIETRRAWLDEEHRATYGWGTPGEYACLMVSDTGEGMDDTTKQRLFDPFFTTKPPGQGTGLGMSMIYGLVKQLRGFVHIYSELGEGSTIKLYFPITSEQAPRSETPASDRQKPDEFGGTETILVAEDEAPIRRAAKRVLERSGYTVLTAEDGQEGLEVFRDQRSEIALVLSDVVMPRLGGAELYEAVQAESPATTFVFMSGHAAKHLSMSGRIDPKARFIYKPWTVTELVRRIRDALDQ
jgi:PAS domain S-box-containing protein